MKTNSKNILSFLFVLFTCVLFAQQTNIKISDYQYSSAFKDRKCEEYLRVTAYFSTGEPPRTFIDYSSGNTTAEDREYSFLGTVDRLEVSVYARDGRSGSFLGCFRSNEIIRETYEILINGNSCQINSISQSNTYEDEVAQSFSFNYQVIPVPTITLDGAFNIEDSTIGYEELLSLSASEGFDESEYQWQYSLDNTNTWINVPRPPSRNLDIRLIDFIDQSVIDREVSFRITSCDGSGESNIITKRCREYGPMTKINISNWDYSVRFDDGRCEEEVRLTAYFSDGTSKRFIRYRKGRFTIGSNQDTEYILEGVVERIDVFMYAKDKVNLFIGKRCAGGSTGGRVRKTYRIEPNIDPCDSGTFYERQSDNNNYIGGNEVRQSLYFDYKITPMPKISRPSESNLMGYEDVLSLNAQEGFNDSAYNWQYSFLEGTPPFEWTDLPGPSSPTREIILADLFDESVIGKEIFFRTSACDNIGTQNVVGYEIRKSAPRITGVSTTPVSCYDTEDGSITVTFDRPLQEGDLFGFTITDRSTPDGEVVANLNDVISFGGNNEITIDNLPPSSTDFLVEMIGTSSGEPYYSGGPDRRAVFEIEKPTPVSFVDEPSDNAVNVFCFGGQDGSITLNAAGGIGNYEYLVKTQDETWDENEWTAFSSTTTHTLENLFPDTYDIMIRDGNGCIAKRQTTIDGETVLGEEIVKRVVITQPDAPLFITTEILNEPTANGFEDGRIMATIIGGTAIDGNKYEFEWLDQNNKVITTTNAVYNQGQGYLVTLHSIGEGTYTITARDANYNNATDKEGCTLISASIVLTQPLPIRISIETSPVSCNAANEYSNNIDSNFDGVPDQFQDGVLIATVTGGVPFDIENPDYSSPVPTNTNGDLVPYFYHWKIQRSDGSWEELSTNDSYIDFLDTATNYSLNVTDRNGITFGIYTAITEADGSRSYTLSQTNDIVTYLSQPEALAIEFIKNDVTCSRGNDATLEAIVTGGVPPYAYEWNNGRATQKINDLIAGTYLVFVTDAKGCQIERTVTIEQPNTIAIEPLAMAPPTCFEGSDGYINLKVAGGVPPYTYLWNTGATTDSLVGLSAGMYRVEITDVTGCKAFYEEILSNPTPLHINIEEKRSLCADQILVLDISIDDPEASYSWIGTNGFTSFESTVTLTETGTYTATVTNGSGCVGIGEVTVESFDRPIDSDFLITTQAYANEDVVLVNVSNPIGETVDWTIPEGVQKISETNEELILKFEKEGTYEINLRSYQGDCYQDFTKTILVQPAIEAPQTSTSQKKFIEEFILYPNPSNGSFKTKISLGSPSNINVKIINLISGATMHERTEKDNQEFLLDYTVSMASGIYLMLLETPNGSETRKLIIE